MNKPLLNSFLLFFALTKTERFVTSVLLILREQKNHKQEFLFKHFSTLLFFFWGVSCFNTSRSIFDLFLLSLAFEEWSLTKFFFSIELLNPFHLFVYLFYCPQFINSCTVVGRGQREMANYSISLMACVSAGPLIFNLMFLITGLGGPREAAGSRQPY